MRGLSLYQPWATFVALGEKGVETRGQRTHYRGDVAICATKAEEPIGDPALEALFAGILGRRGLALETLPRGAVLCVADLAYCLPADEAEVQIKRRIAKRQHPRHELTLGNYRPGRFAWVLQRIRPLIEPYPIRGMQGLFPVAVADQVKIRQRLAAQRAG